MSFQNIFNLTGVKFTQIIESPRVMCVGSLLYVDNPFTGYIEGVYYGHELQRVPADGNISKTGWVSQDWAWYGQSTHSINRGVLWVPNLE